MSLLKINRGYRYRLQPTAAQAEQLARYAGVTRLVYNLALEQRRDYWRQYRRANGVNISFASQCREVTALRAAFDWIAAVPTVATTYALRDLDAAFKRFLSGKSGYPNMRRKGEHDSFRIKGSNLAVRKLNAKWSALRIPVLGYVKFRSTRELPGDIRNAAISLVAGEWYVAFSCEWDAEGVVPSPLSVGIDRGVANTLTLSTGEHVQGPATDNVARRATRAQRRLSRSKKGSARRAIQKQRLATLTARASRARKDWCHRVSTDIARRYGVVAIENLKIKNMTASAKGTLAEPGRNVRQKAGLNRSILEQCWGKFAQFLEYKLTERGGMLISVPAAYTSQTCSSCGVVDARSRKSQAVFACVHCDHTDNADVNAAKEIQRRSTAWLDVEGRVVGPSKRQSEGDRHA